MDDHTIFKKGPREGLLTWRFIIRDNRRVVQITCLCGKFGTLEDHTVDAGYVSPSVWCHKDGGGCGFHAHITLEGYSDGP